MHHKAASYGLCGFTLIFPCGCICQPWCILGIHVRLVFTILLVAVFVLSSALVFWRESDGINWMITVVAIVSFGALLGLATGKARE